MIGGDEGNSGTSRGGNALKSALAKRRERDDAERVHHVMKYQPFLVIIQPMLPWRPAPACAQLHCVLSSLSAIIPLQRLVISAAKVTNV
jgi:hypothetical protein